MVTELRKKVRVFKRCNVEALLDDLRSASWETSSTDIDTCWNHWKATFLDILDRHAPMVNCRIRRNPLPWIDADIRKQMRKRNQLQSQASRTDSEEAWCSYRNLRNKVTGSLRQAKRAYFESIASKSHKSSRGVWKELNKRLGRGKELPSAFEGARCMANQFSSHFSSVTGILNRSAQPPSFPELASSFRFDLID